MSSFPIFMELGHTPPLVVGATNLAAAKVRTLLLRAPRVSVATDDVWPGLQPLIETGRVELVPGQIDEDDIRGRPLVISATGDEAEDTRISALARRLGVPVNVPDRQELSTFLMGALVDRGEVTVAIGTEGAAPVLATHLRAWLERELHPRLGSLAALARRYRKAATERIPPGAPRRAFWDHVLTGPPAEAILAGQEAEGLRLVDRLLAGAPADAQRHGRVILVGAGPGDPDLLTLKAVRALKSADVILHDRLVGAGVLEHARREAQVIPVGKGAGHHSKTQAEINALIIEFARQGQTVVRLKGGDPFVFGRAAEEIAAVQTAGIDVEVIPGVTAAHACAAEIGLPLTLRGKLRQTSLVTGAAGDGEPDLDWAALARSGQAFAIYMGVRTCETITERLLTAGADPEASVVVVENGTLPSRRVIATSLRALPSALVEKEVRGPAILFVGFDWNAAGVLPLVDVEHVGQPDESVRLAPAGALPPRALEPA